MLRYAAAVDLLAGHRSWRAAHLLLSHLLEQTADGAAAAALHAAIARSPSAALVDGLLRTVEQPDGAPPPAVAVAAELLGLRREEAAVRPLVALAGSRHSAPVRQAAVVALGRIGDRSSVDAIALALPDARLTESAGVALLLLGDRRGIDFHARAMAEGRFEGAGTHPGEIVGRYGGPEYLPLLRMVSALGDERSLGALHGLGLLGDPRGVEPLLDALDGPNRAIVTVASGALDLLTGHQEDTDEPGLRNRWRAWWKATADRTSPGIRHRNGAVFDLLSLVDQLSDDDAWVRRTAYDDLVICTGAPLPFDIDGPWRVQRGHIRAWKEWAHRNRARFTPGRWYLEGRPIH
jgi:HEAT repeat protein